MFSWDVQLTPESINELEQTVDYYNFQKTGLGFEFIVEFEKQIEQIRQNPFTRTIRYLNVRFALIGHFPYAIHYVLNEKTHTIVVQTVLSTFKNPETNWKR